MRGAVIAVLGVLAVAACGDGDGGSSGTPTPTAEVTKAEFIEQADALCRDFREATEEVTRTEPSSPEEVADQVDRLATESERTLEKFRALTPPAGDEDVLRRYTESIEESNALIRKLGDAAQANDASAVEAHSRDLQELAQRQRTLAQDYGFKVCGSDQ
jgi:hypothetical protein